MHQCQKIADLGFEGAASYNRSDYKGFFQGDLKEIIKDNAQCRIKVWNDLKDKLVTQVDPPVVKVPQRIEAFCGKLYHKATNESPREWKDSTTVKCPSDMKLIACRYWATTQGNGFLDIASGPLRIDQGCSCTCQHAAKEGYFGKGHWCGCYPVAVCATNPNEVEGSLDEVVAAAITLSPSCK